MVSQGLDQHFVVARFLSNVSQLCTRAFSFLFFSSVANALFCFFLAVYFSPSQRLTRALRE
ncbi:hypothetical protein BDV38DRAFT_232359 [Aspergillus pseudotamarii]|uniref:Transmembrane protein n=1 Tax=Aspergillus pseudotamarii TaxID=132259 RepID=A0A5N6TCD4_ASPPS|nr:uncharacterized protein BDV38DRAFT_232359 [Aspergillus pseudotamarii]KAE8143930.1 hypothetical protein BDV38DRAFT_232359 [Aspergillus pseudotamarii]